MEAIMSKQGGKLVEVVGVKIDRALIGLQDTTIQDMSADGYEHYETININAGEICLRFRRRKEVSNG
jgi:hypothetical protein